MAYTKRKKSTRSTSRSSARSYTKRGSTRRVASKRPRTSGARTIRLVVESAAPARTNPFTVTTVKSKSL